MKNKPVHAFVPAEQVKKKFEVLGDYYQLAGKRCRRLLEIKRRALNGRASQSSRADALVVMMNPGGSKPLAGFYRLDKGLVAAKPDVTQYQIMRLMERLNWDHVRVINLSDLIEPNSQNFIKIFGQSSEDHSIFTRTRKAELDQLIATSEMVFCAWGCDKRLLQLSSQAVGALPPHRLGLPGCALHSYRHPLPRGATRQMQWLEDILEQLAT